MTVRRKIASPPPDYCEHRARWTGLIHDIHHAVAAGGADALASVAHRANNAESCWTPLAPYPRGLVCRLMARAAYTWSRQADADARAELTPVLMASVALVDALIAEPDVPLGARSEGSALPDPTRSSARLPYRED